MPASPRSERTPAPTASRLGEETGKRGGFESQQQELYLNLLRTVSVAGESVHACLKRHGLREAAYNVLRIVAGHGADGVPSQSIAGDMVARVPDITRLVDGLEKRGLVERRRSTSDRRVVHVVATTDGLRLAGRAQKELHRIHLDQFGGLSTSERTRLIRLLERAREREPAPSTP